jgi:hypothetical protein
MLSVCLYKLFPRILRLFKYQPYKIRSYLFGLPCDYDGLLKDVLRTLAEKASWDPANREQKLGGFENIKEIFGPCDMASSHSASAIWGPKNSRFPNPLPLAQVTDLHASKT